MFKKLVMFSLLAPYAYAEVQHLQQVDDLKKEGPAVLMVHASWCGACKHAMPHYKELSDQYSNVQIAAVEAEFMKPFLNFLNFNVSAFPTFLIIKDGKVVDKVIGSNVEEVKQKLNHMANSNAPAQEAMMPEKKKVSEHNEKHMKKEAHMQESGAGCKNDECCFRSPDKSCGSCNENGCAVEKPAAKAKAPKRKRCSTC